MKSPAPPKPLTLTKRECDLAYVVQADGHDRIVKVGRTQEVSRRVYGIKQSLPFPVSLVCVLSDGMRREREMKAILAENKIKGEWFYPSAALNVYLAQAADENAVIIQHKVDQAFSDVHWRPIVERYLNGRDPTYTDAGDFVARFVRDGFTSIAGREWKLFHYCPGAFTAEMLSGFLPAEKGSRSPTVALPAAPAPQEAA